MVHIRNIGQNDSVCRCSRRGVFGSPFTSLGARGFVFNPMRAALVLLSPIFLFVSARGYDEGMLALVASLGAVGFLYNQGNQRHERLLHVVMMATSVLLLLGWKGFEGTFGLGAFVGTMIAGVSWTVLEDGRTGSFGDWLRHPWKMALTAALVVMLAVVMTGFAMQTGTFGVIAERPLVFAVATTVASVHAIGLFLLVGFVLWPLLAKRWSGLAKLRGAGPTMLAVYTAVLLTGVIAYIGALWTLEVELWNRTLFETVLVLGNNGRYATVVLVPLVFLLSWPSEDVDAPSDSGGKPVAFGLSLLVPLMLFVAFHGQQLWSDDAGAWLTDSMGEDESCFVMVAPETLAMHHLYVIKSSVDLTGDGGVDAYWRTAEHVDAFLDSRNECNGLLLVAPNEALLAWQRLAVGSRRISTLHTQRWRRHGELEGIQGSGMMPLPRSDYIHCPVGGPLPPWLRGIAPHW